jgi:hypothetical protein
MPQCRHNIDPCGVCTLEAINRAADVESAVREHAPALIETLVVVLESTCNGHPSRDIEPAVCPYNPRHTAWMRAERAIQRAARGQS